MPTVYIDVTGYCNLRCRHCYATPHRGLHPDISDLLEIIRRLPPGLDITFIGGEPLVRDDLPRLVETAAARGGEVGVVSNSTLFTPELARRLLNAGLSNVACSLDGPTPEIHDWLRGPDAFIKALEGILIINEAIRGDFALTINYTINPRNHDSVIDTFDMLNKLGVYAALSLDRTTPNGAALKHPEVIPSLEHWLEACDQACRGFRTWTRCPSMSFITFPFHLLRLEHAYDLSLRATRYLCPTMTGMFFGRVFADGSLYSCGRRTLFNEARDTGLLPWEGRPALNVLNDRTHAKFAYPKIIPLLRRHFGHPDHPFCHEHCPVKDNCSDCPVANALGKRAEPSPCLMAMERYPEGQTFMRQDYPEPHPDAIVIKNTTCCKELRSGAVLLSVPNRNESLTLRGEAAAIWRDIGRFGSLAALRQRHKGLTIAEGLFLALPGLLDIWKQFGALQHVPMPVPAADAYRPADHH